MEMLTRKSIYERIDRDYQRWYFDMDAKRFKHVKMTVYYSKGGYNYFTSETNRRGYYVSITPVTIHFRDSGFMSEESVLMGGDSGGKLLIEETTRFNAKKMPEMVERGKELIVPFFEQMLAKYETEQSNV